jgi:hypothetical protein
LSGCSESTMRAQSRYCCDETASQGLPAKAGVARQATAAKTTDFVGMTLQSKETVLTHHGSPMLLQSLVGR